MHELPGMTLRCLELAERLNKQGYTVYLPLMFGKPEEYSILANTVHICLSKEFYCFAQNKSSPITDWLRALCRHIYSKPEHRQCSGIGAIGMCLTGGFVLSLMIDEWIMAPVMSQPSLPFALTKSAKFALGVSPNELEQAKERSKNVPILALRFEEDKISPPERFKTLKREFGDRIECIAIAAEARKRDGIPPFPTHAVLTDNFADQSGNPYPSTQKAFERVLAFLQEQL